MYFGNKKQVMTLKKKLIKLKIWIFNFAWEPHFRAIFYFTLFEIKGDGIFRSLNYVR